MNSPLVHWVKVVEELDFPAAKLWFTISDFEHIDRWANLKVRSIEGNSIGCLRTVEMESGLLVTERLIDRDSERMRYTYEVVEPNPYPMRNYRSTMSIQSLPAQRSCLYWEGSYELAENADPTKTDKLLNRVYSGGIELLRKYLSTH